MIRPDLFGCYLSVISHARTANVARVTGLIGPATWFVGAGEGAAYRAEGAAHVVESGALCRSRNAALDAAGSATCVQVSDDLNKVQIAEAGPSKTVARVASFSEALARVLDGMQRTSAKLGGAAPTNNPFYANAEKPIHTGAFIVGDFVVVRPCAQRFNEAMTLKEDYDYTLQHLEQHGVVARRDDVLMTFLHRKNAGGAVDVRTAALEQANIALLKARWSGVVADNPRRPNEILLRLPRVKRLNA